MNSVKKPLIIDGGMSVSLVPSLIFGTVLQASCRAGGNDISIRSQPPIASHHFFRGANLQKINVPKKDSRFINFRSLAM
ncbi:hypothetical protein CEXT_210801 [Caerostris extrusa]|uniref:Uncharacterized protein n=1 Tax=Caerostris extrusa TaxID=172846 RepID=A0AAV4P355_CAEEX|nr:hypothetical protein CEXT_210801 [Caerostris extrusa]